ncbi:LuxR C-terminal-related transcriptional regulator [Amycolatopsis speibonae]|uniref:LuxR C-terminal-related transcriptional regulator n=1 Tax=Amycolatopsis speibonae TaxID=1450224 RepID=A0ABV7NPH5_9PSEU
MRTGPRVLIVESNPVFRGGLGSVLGAAGLRVVGSAADAPSAAPLIMRELPDLVLLGDDDPGSDLEAGLDRILEARADQQVLLLVGRHSRAAAPQLLLRPGVRGRLPREVTDDHLVSVIREIGQNDEWIFVSAPQSALPALLTSERTVLSPREQEVVRLMARSLTNRQIARTLQLSDGTVKRHVHNIVAKLGAASRMDAVRRSVLIPPRSNDGPS